MVSISAENLQLFKMFLFTDNALKKKNISDKFLITAGEKNLKTVCIHI